MKRGSSVRWALLSSALLPAVMTLGACDASIHKGWFVDKPRVLGARAEAPGDPTRATLAPGETGTVTWLLAGPTPKSFAWSFVICAPPEGNFAAVRCAGPVLGAGSGRADGVFIPMSVTFPADAPNVLMLTAFCPDAEPSLDPASFEASCADGSTVLLASTTLASNTIAPNRNPVLADDAIRLGDVVLPPAPPNADPCASGAVTVAQGAEPELLYRFVPEQIEAAPGMPDARENLLLSSFTDTGELDRQYAAFEPDDPASIEARVTWETPTDVGAGGRAAHFYFVLRDGRGGTSFALRSICVRP